MPLYSAHHEREIPTTSFYRLSLRALGKAGYSAGGATAEPPTRSSGDSAISFSGMKSLGESRLAKKRRMCYIGPVDEGRKRVLLIAASILAARSVAQFDRRSPAFDNAISDAISTAERILSKIDNRWPTRPVRA